MHERDTGGLGFLGNSFEGEGNHGGAVAAGFEGGDFPALRVVEEDGAFLCAAEDGYDAAEGGRVVQFWEEVEDEAGAGVQA